MAKLEAEFRTALASLRADLVRWMLIFWVRQLAVLLGSFRVTPTLITVLLVGRAV